MAKLKPVVDVQETFHRTEPPNNGAGPLWCHGSTVVARAGDVLYVTALETFPDEKPLNNCGWVLYRHTDADGWELLHRETQRRTREPCPVGLALPLELDQA